MNIKISVIILFITGLLVFATGCIGDTEPEIQGYIGDLYSEDNETVKAAVAHLSGKGDAAVKPLIGVFSSGNQKASGYAAVTLVYIGDPSIDPLIEALGSNDENTREWSSNVLVFGGQAAVTELIDTVNSGSATAKNMAAITLIKIGEPALPLLNLELNTNPDADLPEISAIIQSIHATENLQEKLNYTAQAA